MMIVKEISYAQLARLEDKFNDDQHLILKLGTSYLNIIVSQENNAVFIAKMREWIELFLEYRLDCLMLVPRKEAPIERLRIDEPISDLIYVSSIYPQPHIDKDFNIAEYCYSIANNLALDKKSTSFMVRDFDDVESYSLIEDSSTFSLAIPHQGPLDYLENCLSYVRESTLQPHETRVYIDEIVTGEHYELEEGFDTADFRKIEPPNQGPYVGRNDALEHAKSPYVCFQDSDDIPTVERFQFLQKACNNLPEIDMFGCHEIRIDDFERRIRVMRFPIDANYALDRNPVHALLHPTTMLKCASIKYNGSFSTERRFASDTQFLLRASFRLKMHNVDRFLYVRHSHSGSLTTTEATKLGTPIRKHLHKIWQEAYWNVQAGNLAIEESELQQRNTSTKFSIIGIKEENSEDVSVHETNESQVDFAQS